MHLEKVTRITPLGKMKRKVYDLSVPNYQNFNANGIFVHNTIEWGLLQEMMAGWLGVDIGEYVHFMASAHIYEEDIEKVKPIIDFDSKYDFYKEISPSDARMSMQQTTKVLPVLHDVEEWTRNAYNGRRADVAVEVSLEKLRALDSSFDGVSFWTDVGRLLISYNMRKAEAKREIWYSILDEVKSIELKTIFHEWYHRHDKVD